MTKTPHPEAAPASRPTLVGRVLGAPRRLAGWLLGHKIMTGLAGSAVAVIGAAALWSLIQTGEKAKTKDDLLTEALARLDAGDNRQARQIAAELRAGKEQSYTDLGGPMFVLGMITAREAQEHFNEQQQQTLYLVASRYLEESRNRGFPPGREREGLVVLGRSLHHSGRFAQSLPYLREALAADPQGAAPLHWLLADSYLRLSPPKLDEAIKHIQAYLALTNLDQHDQDNGRLLESRIQLARRELAAAAAPLTKIAETSPQHAEAVVLRARLTIEQVEAARADGSDLSAEERTALENTISAARKIQGRDGPAGAVLAQAQLLIGRCYELLSDRRAAIAQYDRVRRAFFGRPEAFAASIWQADLVRQEGNAAEAVVLYLRAVQQAGPRDTYQNPWLSLENLGARLQSAGDDLVAREEFAAALGLSSGLSPLLPEVFAVQQQVAIYEAWGKKLAAEAADRPALEMEAGLAEARHKFREAGAAAERLAALRIATRGYLDDLSNSARLFLLGQGHRQAARVFEALLKQNPQHGEAEALVGLGEARLALGELDAARAALSRCRETFPKNPATYRARLLEATALEEQGKLAEAKEILLDNLYHHALTPQSSDWRDSIFALGLLLAREASEYETKSRVAGVDLVDPEAKREGLKLLEQSHTTFQEAIRTLAEASQRYPESPQAIVARYRIAESYRQSAKWPRKKLGVVTIETSRVSLNRQIQQELLSALDEYNRLIAELSDQQQSGRRLPEELAILRNSYFARADALFDLARYEEAIQAYSAATNRYQQTPEALEAYVQIASCYRRLNRPNEARGTLEQARVVLQRIRPDADFTRTTRLDRQQWTDLLAWLRTL